MSAESEETDKPSKVVPFEQDDESEDVRREEAFEQLRGFCEELEASGASRVVLRWIDENRPVHTEDGEMSIESVREVTVKGEIDGDIAACTVEHVPVQIAKGLLNRFEFEVIERNDNLT